MGKCHRCNHKHKHQKRKHQKRKCRKSECANRIPCKWGDQDWKQFGKTLGVSRNANCETEINRHNAELLEVKWTSQPVKQVFGPDDINIFVPGISVEGHYGYGNNLNVAGFVGDDPFGVVFKIDLRDGSVVWLSSRYQGAGNPLDLSSPISWGGRFQPAIGKDALYFNRSGSADNDISPHPPVSPAIIALDKNTGDVIYVSETNTPIGNDPAPTIPNNTSPIVLIEEDDVIIIATSGLNVATDYGAIRGFRASTGDLLWAFQTTLGEDVGVNTGGTGCSIFGNTAVDTARKLVFAGTGQNNAPPASDLQDSIFALNYLTGEFQWKRRFTVDDIGTWPLNCQGCDSEPCEDCTDCECECEQCFYSGGDVKNWDISGGPHLDTLCIDGKYRDVVVAGSKEGKLYILDRESDTQEGILYNEYVLNSPAPTGSSNQGINYSGCTDGKYYYFLLMYTTDGLPIGLGSPNVATSLFKIDPKDGKILFRKEFPNGHAASPTFANGVVYFNTIVPGTFYAVDACTGETLKTLETNVNAACTTVSEGSVYISDVDKIYALDLSGSGYHSCKSAKSKSAKSKDVLSQEQIEKLMSQLV